MLNIHAVDRLVAALFYSFGIVMYDVPESGHGQWRLINKIEYIRVLRSLYGMSLLDAKLLVDRVFDLVMLYDPDASHFKEKRHPS